MNKTEAAIMMVKPCGRRVYIAGYPVEELIKGMVVSSGLEIVRRSEKHLTREDVHNIYPILNVPDTEFGEDWKEDVVQHLTSGPVSALLLTGERAENKARIIKNHLRATLLTKGNGFRSKVVENIAHVADGIDFPDTLRVLFGE